MINRRKFLGEASCAGMGYLTLLNTIVNLKAINAAAISNSTVASNTGYKAIVCIGNAGGNDSFNMLVPYDQTSYDEYELTRGANAVAIPRSDLLDLDFNNGGKEFALNPNMPELKELFNASKASLISNVGTLVQPTTLADYENDNFLPKGLYSHNDQIQEWHTSIANERTFIGWAGRVNDLLQDQNTNDLISMNITLSGINVLQSGNSTISYAVDRNQGSVGITGYNSALTAGRDYIRTKAIDSLLVDTYMNMFEQTYINTLSTAKDAHAVFSAALDNSTVYAADDFPDTTLGESLEMVAKIVEVQAALGMTRQIFFIDIGGWDHHSELINTQGAMLSDVSSCLKSFMDALETLGMQDDVLTINLSEFGRTLTWNGGGTDHAWGGNVWVMGGTGLINGKQIFGTYPSLALENNDSNVHPRGRLIPTISTDEYFAEIAKWFGVPPVDLPYVFPNIGNFYNPYSSDYPIGFIKQ